jgi:pSer/pThr/pTyr-binding forkhead associated (FHA) protein
MPAQLLALSEGPNILLDKPIMLFGRNPECDIQIDSRKVSRRHCCVAQVSDYLVVRDLGSTNGIRINGVRVVEGRLKAGDELTIGSHRYQVRWDALEPSGSRGASLVIPRKTGPIPVPAPVDEDDMLEECDEPVPLQEPGGAPIEPRKPALPHVAVTAVADASEEDVDAESVEDEQVPLVLPENLDLAPSSDVVHPDRPKL